MRSITGDSRRAKQDMDIDFIRYSISDESVQAFIHALDCLPDIHIEQTGIITELKQQDYHGKRVFVRITDNTGDAIESKIDLSAFADAADQNNNPAHASESLLLCMIFSRISTALATIFGQNSVNR